MADLKSVVSHLERELRTSEITDYPGAWNGLQVENSGTVTRIGAAVDACEAVIQQATERKIDLLVVHHGLFWQGVQPIVGAMRRKLRLALEVDLAIYSSHLPLDLHPTLGNNALLAAALGFKESVPFLTLKGQPAGLQCKIMIPREELVQRLGKAVAGPVHLRAGGPEIVRRVGLVTGGAGSEVLRAAAEGVDTFITGEGPHWSFPAAEEAGVNLLFAGHYATETFGVKALAAHLAERFQVPWEFLDHPTGL